MTWNPGDYDGGDARRFEEMERVMAGERIVAPPRRQMPRPSYRLHEVLCSVNGNVVGEYMARLSREAAACIELLHTDVLAAERRSEADSGGARAFAAIMAALAKFDGEDWAYLLGEGEYGPTGPSKAYSASGRGGREQEWQKALAEVRKIVEEAR